MTATSVRNGLSSDYASFFKEKKTAKVKRFGLPKVSPKMAKQLKEYRVVKAIWWAARMEIDGGRCQFVDQDFDIRCRRRAMEQPHHRNGRGKFLSEPGTFLACCWFHHDWIEHNKREARAMGLITYK